jgi:hypothetical protein
MPKEAITKNSISVVEFLIFFMEYIIFINTAIRIIANKV